MDNDTYSKIVPDDLQIELINYNHATTDICFRIGDIANEICNGLDNINQKYSQQMVYSAVGYFCGKSGRTVRHYASVASFFDKEVRDEYSALSFSHFSFAKQMGDRWREVLDYAVTDYIHSVDNVMEHFLTPQGRDVSINDVANKMYDISNKMSDLFTHITSNISQDRQITNTASNINQEHIFRMIDNAINILNNISRIIPIKNSTSAMLEDIISMLQDIKEELKASECVQ